MDKQLHFGSANLQDLYQATLEGHTNTINFILNQQQPIPPQNQSPIIQRPIFKPRLINSIVNSKLLLIPSVLYQDGQLGFGATLEYKTEF